MIRGYYNKASLESKSVIAIDALHGYAAKRLVDAQQRLHPTSAFAKAAQNKGDSILGGLLLNMMTWGVLMHGIDSMLSSEFGIDLDLDLSHDGFLASATEAYDFLVEGDPAKKAGRKLEGYPEGRRRDPLEKAAIHKKFNLLAANENSRYSPNAESEVIALTQLLEMLEALAKDGVRTLAVDHNQPVFASLKNATRAMKGDGMFKSFPMAVRKAV